MTKRMLIDATHAEETRVVVLDGNRLEDFDVETSTKKQLKGNIYLAKIIRVEPSLQAAFVEYGGGRHGFLAFSEIHPDYYQIPVADRERLLRLQAEEAREEEEREDADGEPPPRAAHPMPVPAETGAAPSHSAPRPGHVAALPSDSEVTETQAAVITVVEAMPGTPSAVPADPAPSPEAVVPPAAPVASAPDPESVPPAPAEQVADRSPADPVPTRLAAASPSAEVTATEIAGAEAPAAESEDAETVHRPAQAAAIEREERFGAVADYDAPPPLPVPAEDGDTLELEPSEFDTPSDMPPPETIGGEHDGGEGAEEARARRAARFLRNYRIQEVIKRRQIMLVQVVKEERGTKGAALTTYISLAGRYCVLMPNSPRGGGISRKITSPADRRRLKEITAELDVPSGMGLIVRTAGANRPKPEIKRDCEYLMRLWDDIREHTLKSVAPALIYEEASLIKRAIRDVYSRDIDEVTVDGEEGWRGAHDFMRMLMPSHAKKVQLWRGNGQPLFAKYQVEAQLDAMLTPTVQLRSGGYLVINQTEALVAIDVNSGRSTRERGIEETALRTNMEAADEVARQLRLRDLAGLIVIDFIDMEARKHNAMVERRLKEALKSDRARIQVGHISHFGLLEMSRQRLRPSLAETSFSPCPHCGGTGHVRSIDGSAIHVLRAIEEEGAKGRASAIRVQVAGSVALYLLNHKRERLAEIEARYAMRVTFEPDESLIPPQIRIERLRPQVPDPERPAFAPVVPTAPALPGPEEEEESAEAEEATEAEGETATEARAPQEIAEAQPQAGEDAERRRRRRRRRRGGRRETAGAETGTAETDAEGESEDNDAAAPEGEAPEGEAPEPVAPAPMEAMGEAEAPPAAAPPPDLSLAEQPSIDADALDEAGQPRARRRGRRGGRRRAGGEAVAAPVVEAPPAPVYSGPTPADPFGGVAFDLFDMMDEVIVPAPIQEAVPAAPPPLPEPLPEAVPPIPETSAAEAAPEAEANAPAEEPLVVEPLPAETPTAEPEPADAAVAAVQAEAVQAEAAPAEAAPAAGAEPAPEEPEAAEPPPAVPVVRPVVIGAEEAPPAEPRRGWWRR